MEPDTAILHFSIAELGAAGRRVKHRMQNLPSAGIYGDDYGHRTLWSEFRYEMREGPTLMEEAWDDIVRPYASEVVAEMPAHTKALLCWYLEYYEGGEPDGSIDEGAVANAICESAKELAAW